MNLENMARQQENEANKELYAEIILEKFKKVASLCKCAYMKEFNYVYVEAELFLPYEVNKVIGIVKENGLQYYIANRNGRIQFIIQL